VVFVLATTEPHKMPATILSRCQQTREPCGSLPGGPGGLHAMPWSSWNRS
jgi:hypothetical protein